MSYAAVTQTATRSTPAGRKSVRKPATVTKVRVKAATGEQVINYSIDANSENFADDFLYVFTKNVEKARARDKAPARSRRAKKKA